MARAVDVHEHCAADEKCVLVNSGVLAFGHVGQSEDPLPQLLVEPGRSRGCIHSVPLWKLMKYM